MLVLMLTLKAYVYSVGLYKYEMWTGGKEDKWQIEAFEMLVDEG